MQSSALLAEFERRMRPLEAIKADLFAAQKKVIADTSRKIALQCSRRAGKTHLCAALTLCGSRRAGMMHPQAPEMIVPYIALTKDHARRLLWPIIKKMDSTYVLNLRYDEQRLIASWPDGRAKVWLTGADKIDEMEKLRGGAYPMAVIDEAGSFDQKLTYLIEEVLKYALEDYGGQLILASTPNARCTGAFYAACHNELPGYSLHRWSTCDNEYFPRWAGKPDWQERAKAWLIALREENKWQDDHPVYRREALGEWVRDEASMVFAFNRQACTYEDVGALPPAEERVRILGVDIGYNDACAFAVMTYGPHDTCAYLEYEYQRSGMSVSDVADAIHRLRNAYGPSRIVMDVGGLGKMIAAELNTRYGLGIEPADKAGKLAFIEIANSDLRKGLLKIPLGGGTAEQLATIQWAADRKKEDPMYPNDAADAMLYAYRALLHYRAGPRPIPVEPESEEWYKLERERLIAQRARQGKK